MKIRDVSCRRKFASTDEIRRFQILLEDQNPLLEHCHIAVERFESEALAIEVTIAALHDDHASFEGKGSRVDLIRYVNSTPLLDYFGECNTCILSRSRSTKSELLCLKYF